MEFNNNKGTINVVPIVVSSRVNRARLLTSDDLDYGYEDIYPSTESSPNYNDGIYDDSYLN